METGLKGQTRKGYVVMAMSDMGYPVFPFDVAISFDEARKWMHEEVDRQRKAGEDIEISDTFDFNFVMTFQKYLGKVSQGRIAAHVQLRHDDTLSQRRDVEEGTFPVSVFKSLKDAKDFLVQAEPGDCGQQYMLWHYKEAASSPPALKKFAETVLNRSIDWGVFEAEVAHDGTCEITSEQCLANYFTDNYYDNMFGRAKNMAPDGIIAQVEKEFREKRKPLHAYGDVKKPEKLKALCQRLDPDKWVFFRFGEDRPPVKAGLSSPENGQRVVKVQVVEDGECSAESLGRTAESAGDGKYFVFTFEGGAYEIDQLLDFSNRVEAVMVPWGMDEGLRPDADIRYWAHMLDEAFGAR